MKHWNQLGKLIRREDLETDPENFVISAEHHTCLIPNINVLASKAGGGEAVGLGGGSRWEGANDSWGGEVKEKLWRKEAGVSPEELQGN